LEYRKISRVLPLALVFGFLAACTSTGGLETQATNGKTTNFGKELLLSDYSVHQKDGHTEIELRWKALQKPSGDYLVFVHAVDSEGKIVFQFDHALKNAGGLSTSNWAPGEAVSDRFSAAPPAGNAAGTYPLRLGVYIAQPIHFLPISETTFPQPQDGWKNQSVLIEHVECK
jgi:hypothetical protein